MKIDYSRILYDKYFSLKNRNIEIELISKRIVKGIIIGFYKSVDKDDSPFIMQWHIVDEKDKMSFGIDAFGNLIGEIINQKDILNVKFLDDNSQLNIIQNRLK